MTLPPSSDFRLHFCRMQIFRVHLEVLYVGSESEKRRKQWLCWAVFLLSLLISFEKYRMHEIRGLSIEAYSAVTLAVRTSSWTAPREFGSLCDSRSEWLFRWKNEYLEFSRSENATESAVSLSSLLHHRRWQCLLAWPSFSAAIFSRL